MPPVAQAQAPAPRPLPPPSGGRVPPANASPPPRRLLLSDAERKELRKQFGAQAEEIERRLEEQAEEEQAGPAADAPAARATQPPPLPRVPGAGRSPEPPPSLPPAPARAPNLPRRREPGDSGGVPCVEIPPKERGDFAPPPEEEFRGRGHPTSQEEAGGAPGAGEDSPLRAPSLPPSARAPGPLPPATEGVEADEAEVQEAGAEDVGPDEPAAGRRRAPSLPPSPRIPGPTEPEEAADLSPPAPGRPDVRRAAARPPTLPRLPPTPGRLPGPERGSPARGVPGRPPLPPAFDAPAAPQEGGRPAGRAVRVPTPERSDPFGLADVPTADPGGFGEGVLSEQQRNDWDETVKKLADAADKLLKFAEKVGAGKGDAAPTGQGAGQGVAQAARAAAESAPGGGKVAAAATDGMGHMRELFQLFEMLGPLA